MLTIVPQISLLYGLTGVFNTHKITISDLLGEKTIIISQNQALLFQFITCLLYFLLFYYFDQIFPNEYGISKSIFFPCKRRKVMRENFHESEMSSLKSDEYDNKTPLSNPSLRSKQLLKNNPNIFQSQIVHQEQDDDKKVLAKFKYYIIVGGSVLQIADEEISRSHSSE